MTTETHEFQLLPDIGKTPDFDFLARRIGIPGFLNSDPEWFARAIADQLRQVWNARGAADADQIMQYWLFSSNAPLVGTLSRAVSSLDCQLPENSTSTK